MKFEDNFFISWNLRVWDSVNSKMVYCLMPEFFNDGILFRFEGLKIKNVVCMRSVGLYDLNGKMIYEGDILKARDVLDDDRDFFVGCVVFRDGSFIIASPFESNYRWLDYEVEVLGNFYEDQNLVDEYLN
jgi:uncharacterized phage protein (TIGR01671 family)